MVEADFDPTELDAVGEEDPVLARFPVAAGLIQKANCRSCHLAQGRLVGPGFHRIAERYIGQESARLMLSEAYQLESPGPDAGQNGARRRNRSLPSKLQIQGSYKDLGDDGVSSLSQRAVRML